MEAVWIGLDGQISIELILHALKERFNLSKCLECSLDTLCELLESLNLKNIHDDKSIVFYTIKKNESEFPTVIEFLWFEDYLPGVRIDIYIAYYLSRVFNCWTITDATGLGIDKNVPYWDIVFDCGKAYLGDDSGTKFFDEGEEPVKLVRELDLNEIIPNFNKVIREK